MCNYDCNQVEVAYIYHVAKFYDPIENILKVPNCKKIALPDEVNILVRSDKKKLYLI